MCISFITSSGIAYLSQGMHQEALQSFHSALSIAGSHLLGDASAEATRDVPSNDNAAVVRGGTGKARGDRQIAISGVQLTNLAAFDDSAGSSSPNNHFLLYNRAMAFSLQSGRQTTDQCDLEVPCVVLYNLALVYHQVGLLSANVGALHKALQIYELCVSALPLEDTSSGNKMEEGLDVLELALYNNLGHIHSHFFNSKEIKLYRECLRAKLESIEVSANCATTDLQADCRLFYQSMLRSHAQQVELAPAA